MVSGEFGWGNFMNFTTTFELSFTEEKETIICFELSTGFMFYVFTIFFLLFLFALLEFVVFFLLLFYFVKVFDYNFTPTFCLLIYI